MKRLLLMVVLAMLPVVAMGDDIDPSQIKTDIEIARSINVKLFKKLAPALRVRVSKSGLRGKELTAAKKELEQILKSPPAIPILTSPNFRAGQWGVPYNFDFYVVQVIDDQTFIGKAPNGNLCYVKGFSTSSTVDKQHVTLRNGCTREDHTVVKIGTETYQTVAGGSNTVLSIELMDVSEFADEIWGKVD